MLHRMPNEIMKPKRNEHLENIQHYTDFDLMFVFNSIDEKTKFMLSRNKQKKQQRFVPMHVSMAIVYLLLKFGISGLMY